MPEQSNLYFLCQVPSQTNCLQGDSAISLARHFLLTVSCKWQTAGYIVEILTANRINSKGRNLRGKQKDERRRNILLQEVSRQQTRKRSRIVVIARVWTSNRIVAHRNWLQRLSRRSCTSEHHALSHTHLWSAYNTAV